MAAALLVGACSRGGGETASPTSTVPSTGLVAAALLNESQLRRVPGFSTAVVTSLPTVAAFDEENPVGPCGGPVPRLDLDDAMAASWRATTIRTGAQLVVRRPAAELQRYMAARIADARADCPAYKTKSRAGVTQEMSFDEAIRVTRDADQSLAVVMAVRAQGSLRALTTIEVRSGNLLARAVILTNRPPATPTVRGIASLMAKALAAVS